MTLEYEVEMDEEHLEACITALEFYLDQHALFIGDATVKNILTR